MRLPLHHAWLWAVATCVAAALLEGILSGTGIKGRLTELRLPKGCSAALGLAGRGQCLLSPLFSFTEIDSDAPGDTTMDLSHDRPFGTAADRECELELDLLSKKGPLAELRLLCTLLVVVADARGGSESYSKSALRVVCPLSRLSFVCKLVGLSSLAAQ